MSVKGKEKVLVGAQAWQSLRGGKGKVRWGVISSAFGWRALHTAISV